MHLQVRSPVWLRGELLPQLQLPLRAPSVLLRQAMKC